MSKYKHIVIEAENVLWEQKECGLNKDPCAVKVHEDIPVALQEMKLNKMHIFVVTNIETEMAEDLLGDCGISDFIEGVQGTNLPGEVITWADMFGRLRNNQGTRKGYDFNPSNTIMILSSVKGVLTAINQKFTVIGVMSDEVDPAELQDAGARVVAQVPCTISSAVAMLENQNRNHTSFAPKLEI